MIKFSEALFTIQKQLLHEKICNQLKNIADSKGYIMYFCLNNKCYATTEENRISFNNLKDPKQGTVKEEDFEAINLDDLVNGKKTSEIIEKDQINKIKVLDLDKICKILSDKYKVFTMPNEK